MPTEVPPLRVRAIRAVVIALLLQSLFVFFFVLPAHEPAPNDFPLGVAGPVQAAEQVQLRLQGEGFDVERFEDAGAARAAILDREVYGALVAGPDGIEQVLVASAASQAAAQIVAGLGQAAGAEEIVELRPLAEGDPRGVTLNVLILPLVITAILGALVAVNLVPELNPVGRTLLAGLAAVGGAVVAVLIANVWLDALAGPVLAEVGVITLAVWAIALASAGLIRLIGPAGTAVPFLLFLMLGNPASGIASAPELLPSPWYELGGFLPPGALGDALRGTAYFGGADVLDSIVVLVVWLVLGFLLLLAGARRGETEHDVESARPVPA